MNLCNKRIPYPCVHFCPVLINISNYPNNILLSKLNLKNWKLDEIPALKRPLYQSNTYRGLCIATTLKLYPDDNWKNWVKCSENFQINKNPFHHYKFVASFVKNSISDRKRGFAKRKCWKKFFGRYLYSEKCLGIETQDRRIV